MGKIDQPPEAYKDRILFLPQVIDYLGEANAPFVVIMVLVVILLIAVPELSLVFL